MPSDVELGVGLGRFASLPARADSEVQRSKAITPLAEPGGRAGTYPSAGKRGIVQSP